MNRSKLAALAVLSFSMGACTSEALLCAADLACINGLYVQLAATPAGPYRIDVMAPGLVAPKTYDCATATPCEVAPFRDFRPTTATVTVTYHGRTSSTNITPSYVDAAAASCEPSCKTAVVTVPLP